MLRCKIPKLIEYPHTNEYTVPPLTHDLSVSPLLHTSDSVCAHFTRFGHKYWSILYKQLSQQPLAKEKKVFVGYKSHN